MRHVSPPSSDRQICPRSVAFPFHGIPSPVSISAYMRLGFDGAMATPTLPTPTSCFGMPLVTRFQVLPPSIDLYTPIPSEILVLQPMNASPVPAQTILGSEGATASAPIAETG